MSSVRELLDAIRNLPRPDRLRLVEALLSEFDAEPSREPTSEPPLDSNLEVRSGFYVYVGPVDDRSLLDHRLVREERADRLGASEGARRD